MFWTLTPVTLKSIGQIKTRVLCHVSLEMTQPLAQELYQFFIWFWPPVGQAKNQTTEIWSVSYSYLVVHNYMYKVSGQ
jgi:hypothetical protein